MLYGSLTDKNKHSNIRFEEYLFSTNEPQYSGSSYSNAELKAELLDTSYVSRRHLRTSARHQIRYF